MIPLAHADHEEGPRQSRGHRASVRRSPDAPGTRVAQGPARILRARALRLPRWQPATITARRGTPPHNPPKSIERIRERTGVDFQIRDIRRTVATRITEDLGITPFIIAKVMDHKLPGEAEMGDVYNRYDYLAEKRQALSKWCDHLSRVIGKARRPGLRLVRSRAAS